MPSMMQRQAAYAAIATKMLEVRVSKMLIAIVTPTIKADETAGRIRSRDAGDIVHALHKMGNGTVLQAELFDFWARKLEHFYAHVPTCKRLGAILALRQTSMRHMERDTIAWLEETFPETWEQVLLNIEGRIVRDNFVYELGGFFTDMCDALGIGKPNT